MSLGLGILILKSQESELMMMGLSIFQPFNLIKERDDDQGKKVLCVVCFSLNICEDKKMKSMNLNSCKGTHTVFTRIEVEKLWMYEFGVCISDDIFSFTVIHKSLLCKSKGMATVKLNC